jgi:hypothetical protein
MICFAVVLHSPGFVRPWLEEKVVVALCMDRQEFDYLVMVREALLEQYSDCVHPIRLEVSLGGGRGTSKTLYLFSKMQATRQLEKSKNHHHADLVKASGMLAEFEG